MIYRPLGLIFTFVSSLVAQDGAVPFAAAQDVVGNFDRIEAVLDLDLDGLPDFVIRHTDSAVVTWRPNRGDGLPGASHSLPNLGAGARFAVTDFNSNGEDDLMIYAGGSLVVVESRTGAPLVLPPVPFPTLGDLQFGDIDGDGNTDFVGAEPFALRGYSMVGGVFTELLSIPIPGGSGLPPFFLADFDADGRIDVWHSNDSWVWIRGLDGAGSMELKQFYGNPFGAQIHGVAGDIDGDGDEDVLNFTASRRYAVIRAKGPGTWMPEPLQGGGPATIFGDIDGDGDLDGLFSGGGGGPFPDHRLSNFEVSINDGTGNFAPAWQIPGIGALGLIVAATDMDADGDMDLVAGRCVVFHPGEIEAMRPLRGSYGTREADVYDFEGDGPLDFGVASLGNRTFLARGVGDGSLRPSTIYTNFGIASTHLRLTGDFDGDGVLDVLVEEAAGPQVMLYRGTGGNFIESRRAAAPAESMAFESRHNRGSAVSLENQWTVVADNDGDGDLDAWLMDETTGWSKCWTNDGTGFFTHTLSLASDGVLAVADLNGDGTPDLITTPFHGRSMQVRMANPTSATYASPVALLDADRDDRPGVVDIDGDGDLDVFASSASGGSLYRNNGAGSFTPTPLGGPNIGDVAAGLRGTVDWSIGDLNDDGRLDAVAYRRYYDDGRTTTVFMQTATGFAAGVRIIAKGLRLGDTDQDGDSELIGDFIFRNLTPAPEIGSTTAYGVSYPGKGYIFPLLNNAGSMHAGGVVEKRAVGVRGGAPGFFVFGLQQTSVILPQYPGLVFLVGQAFAPLPIVATGPNDAAGAGTWTLPWVVPTGLPGLTLYSQAFFLDDESLRGVSATNGTKTVLPH